MRRFVPLVVLLFFSLPLGIAINGCGGSSTATRIFCDNNSGLVVGEIATITLQPQVFGISLNAGQIASQRPSATAADCKGAGVSATFTYNLRKQDFDSGLADIQPTTGLLCAGRWNRNSGGGIPDYTVCNATGVFGTAMMTASASPATSNAVPIFVHPVAPRITNRPPSTNCATDLATNCCPFSTVGTVTTPTGTFNGNACLSQNVTGQIAARVFANGGTNIANNITCSRTGTDSAGNPTYAPLIGHIGFTPQDNSSTPVVSIDENGIATAKNPGTTLISASISNASSSAGYFSTCPPASIQLAVPNQGSNTSITVNQNNTEPITATVIDTNGVTLTGVPLQLVSTTPRTLPSGGSGSVTPIFPGAGSVTAICLPPSCNGAPLNQVGLFGTGLPITSNAINVTTPGTSSSVLYAASTQSQYITSIDFTSGVLNAPVRLPYVPNSMVLSNSGGSAYLGSSTELMTFAASTGALAREDRAVPGKVLAVSPDDSTVVITDPTRGTISLYAATASTPVVSSVYGGVGLSAQFSPDSSTVYIAAGNQIIIHSNYTGWTAVPNITANGVAVAVPSVGAFFAGPVTTARSYCALTTTTTTNGQPSTTNQFFPDARIAGPPTDLVAATNDGMHLIGVTSAAVPTLSDLAVNVEQGNTGLGTACPANGLTFTARPLLANTPVPGVAATAVTGLVPSSDSAVSFLTYRGAGGRLPFYLTGSATVPGTLGSVALAGAATAPVGGVFASDNQTFFAGTSGDNLIHLITRNGSTFADTTAPLDPRLLDPSGNAVPADLLAQRPRRIN